MHMCDNDSGKYITVEFGGPDFIIVSEGMMMERIIFTDESNSTIILYDSLLNNLNRAYLN